MPDLFSGVTAYPPNKTISVQDYLKRFHHSCRALSNEKDERLLKFIRPLYEDLRQQGYSTIALDDETLMRKLAAAGDSGGQSWRGYHGAKFENLLHDLLSAVLTGKNAEIVSGWLPAGVTRRQGIKPIDSVVILPLDVYGFSPKTTTRERAAIWEAEASRLQANFPGRTVHLIGLTEEPHSGSYNKTVSPVCILNRQAFEGIVREIVGNAS